ncbi:IclR family transcriptional regulator C-terminal domain-containing protein [Thermocatellispora tengchongensis]|uniref:IclR family transcriptional regulator domain-containing protein n=1 Tax=Thermocatellispora tengchongensis TaxID=1073253 RepID=UPI003639FE0C
MTAGTPTGRAAVEAAIAAARERGYAVNDGGWWRPEVGAVAAAITGKSGVAAAALSLSVPLMRLTEPRVAELGPLVVAAAEEISANLRLL